MPHVSNPHGQVNQKHNSIDRVAPEVKPRDDLRTAYGGDRNKSSDKSRRLNEKSGRTPVR